MALSYQNYLKIDELLSLQELKSPGKEHDETLFIIIHQTYELWFKQILHELTALTSALKNGNSWQSAKTLRRILTILKTLVSQVDILETMTPLSFNSFRYFLEHASGFQSVQFREIEILCGFHSPLLHRVMEQDGSAKSIIQQRLNSEDIHKALAIYLQKQGFDAPTPTKIREKGLVYDESKELQSVLIQALRENEEVALILDLFVDLDEGFMEWRYRHVKLVQRTIGFKSGTGGSDGSGYLSKTLNQHFFPDLWAIRSDL